MRPIPFRAWPQVAFSAVAMLACSTSFADGPSPAAPGPGDFTYQKALKAPTTVEIVDRNGAVRMEPSSGDALEVVAVKSGRASDLAKVTVIAREDAGAVVFCALWPGEDASSCRAGAEPGGSGVRDDEARVRVDFRVRVPKNAARVNVRSMNGAIVAQSAPGEVNLRTMNGAIEVAASGPITAHTMNGRVSARAAAGQRVDLETKNGSIELTLAAAANADVDASTMNGHVVSELGAVPPPMLPRIHDARFRIGAGGPRVSLHTMNGDVNVRRGG